MGVGGISSWHDAVQYVMAGASAFQIGSAVMTHGPEVFDSVNKGLVSFMDEYGYRSIADMRGVAH